MRVHFSGIVAALLATQAPAAVRTVIPNGGPGYGSLSLIDPFTGIIERSMQTATSDDAVINSDFVITNTGESAAVLATSGSSYILSLLNVSAGTITAQRKLSVAAPPAIVNIAANPKTSFIYLTYVDSASNTHIQKINASSLDTVLDSNLGTGAALFMTVAPDGKNVYLTGFGYADVTAVNAQNLKPFATLPLVNAFYAAISPDSSTLYVPAGEYPNMALSYINATTLQVTQTAPLSAVSTVFGMTISTDGSQLYFPAQENFQGSAIFTFDIATENLMNVPAVVTGNIAASPDGTVYVGADGDIAVFDPATQSVTNTLLAYSNGSLALNSAGNQILFLNEFSSTLAVTGAPPSQNIVKTASTGFQSSVVFDSTNNLFLVADYADGIEMLNRDLQPAGRISIPNLDYAFLNTSGGLGFATSSTPQVYRFDPVSLQVTGTATIPSRQGDNVFNYTQPVLSGSMLYVPFQFYEQLISSEANQQSTPGTGIAEIDTSQMTVTAVWPFKTLPTLGVAPAGKVAYAVFPEASQILDLDMIDLSTGQILKHAQVPGLNTTSIYSNPVVSPDGSAVYFSNNDTLYSFNSQTLALTDTVPGIGLVNVAISPDGDYLYGSTPPPCRGCAIEYSLQIVSTATLAVVGTIPSAYQPGTTLFVSSN